MSAETEAYDELWDPEHLPRMVDVKESILVSDAGAVVLLCAHEKKWACFFSKGGSMMNVL